MWKLIWSAIIFALNTLCILYLCVKACVLTCFVKMYLCVKSLGCMLVLVDTTCRQPKHFCCIEVSGRCINEQVCIHWKVKMILIVACYLKVVRAKERLDQEIQDSQQEASKKPEKDTKKAETGDSDQPKS